MVLPLDEIKKVYDSTVVFRFPVQPPPADTTSTALDTVFVD
jgi:hypothetical protein